MASFRLTIWLLLTLSGAQISRQQIISGDGARRGGRQVAPMPAGAADPSPTGLSYRALATNHYRNLYRNRNYFVRTDQDKQEHNTVIPALKEYKPIEVPRAPVETSNQNPVRSSETPLAPPGPKQYEDAAHPDDPFVHHNFGHRESESQVTAGMNDPILFEDAEATPYSAYVRPLEPVEISTPSSTTSNVPDSKHAPTRKFEPVPDGKTPPCAQDAVYCESFSNYPKKLLNDVLERSITPQEFQQVYGDTTDNSTKITDLKSILQRTGLSSGTAVEETPLCSAVEHTIYPQVARNKENRWMYVVNHDEYIQGVRIEKCLDEGQSCFYGDTAPIGYQTACRQKYIYKKLLALTPEGRTSSESFKLPSCCACFVKTASIADRILGTAVGSSQISRPATKAPGGSYYTYETENQDDIDNTTELFFTTQSMETFSK